MTGGATIRLYGHLLKDGPWYNAVKRACLLFYSDQGVCPIVKEVFLGNGLKRIQDSELAERLRTDTLCRGHDMEKTEIVLDQDAQAAVISKDKNIGHQAMHLDNKTQQSGGMAGSDTNKIREPLTQIKSMIKSRLITEKMSSRAEAVGTELTFLLLQACQKQTCVVLVAVIPSAL